MYIYNTKFAFGPPSLGLLYLQITW